MAKTNTIEDSDIDALRDRAQELAHRYNGSSKADDTLLTVVTDYEGQFNAAGKPPNYPPADTFLNEALHTLSQSWKNATSLDDFLTKLEQAGTRVVRHKDVLIKPVNKKPETNGQQQQWKNAKFLPRLAMVMAALQEKDIHTDQIEMHVSQIDPNSMRKRPYIIVNVYDDKDKDNGGLQIAVCDQKGEISFTSDTIYNAAYFKDMDKTMLRALPGMNPVRHVNDENFIARLLAPLDAREQALCPSFVNADAVKKKRAKQEKIILNHDLIRKIARDVIKMTGRPMTTLNTVYLPDGTTGKAIAVAFRRKLHGLNDTPHDGLPAFLRAENLDFHLDEGIVDTLIKNWIRDHNGEVPTQRTDGDVILPNGIKTTWLALNLHIAGRSGKHEDFPKERYTGVGHFIKTKKLGLHLDEGIVETLIKNWIRDHNGEVPTLETDGDVILPNGIKTTWKAIDPHIAGKNGNHDDFPNGRYKGIGEFKVKKGLNMGGEAYNAIIAEMENTAPDDDADFDLQPA